jgi:hypothetical protein
MVEPEHSKIVSVKKNEEKGQMTKNDYYRRAIAHCQQIFEGVRVLIFDFLD